MRGRGSGHQGIPRGRMPCGSVVSLSHQQEPDSRCLWASAARVFLLPPLRVLLPFLSYNVGYGQQLSSCFPRAGSLMLVKGRRWQCSLWCDRCLRAVKVIIHGLE